MTSDPFEDIVVTKKRNLTVLWIAQFIVMAGMSSVVPFLPLYIRELGITDLHSIARWSGWVNSGPFLIWFFASPVWGWMGDRWSKKWLIVRANFGLAIAVIFTGLSANVYQLLFFRMLQGLLSGFYPAVMAMIASQSSDEDTAKGISSIQSAYISGGIIGPLIGGVLSEWIGFRLVFIVTGIVIILMGILIIIFVQDVDHHSKTKSNRSIADNLRYVFKKKTIFILLTMMAFAAFGDAFLRPIFALYIESFLKDRNFIAAFTGILISVQGFTAAISAVIFGRRITKNKMHAALVIALIGTAVMQVLQGLAPTLIVLFAVRFCLGFFFGLIFPMLFSSIIVDTEADRKSGVMGIVSSFQTLGNLIGPLSSGYLLVILDFKGVFVFSGAVYFFIALLLKRQRSKIL